MAKKAKSSTKKSTKKATSGFMKPLQPDEALAAVVGSKPLPRTQVTKDIWIYIKKHKLQDKADKRQIIADEKLLKVFNGKKSVSMFEMTKLISTHLS